MPATKVMQWYAYVFASIGALDAAATVGIVLLMLKTVVHDPDVASIMLETLPFVALFTVFECKYATCTKTVFTNHNLKPPRTGRTRLYEASAGKTSEHGVLVSIANKDPSD